MEGVAAPVKSARRRDENADVVGAAQMAHELEEALERAAVLLLTLHEAGEDASQVVLQAAAREGCMYNLDYL